MARQTWHILLWNHFATLKYLCVHLSKNLSMLGRWVPTQEIILSLFVRNVTCPLINAKLLIAVIVLIVILRMKWQIIKCCLISFVNNRYLFECHYFLSIHSSSDNQKQRGRTKKDEPTNDIKQITVIILYYFIFKVITKIDVKDSQKLTIRF